MALVYGKNARAKRGGDRLRLAPGGNGRGVGAWKETAPDRGLHAAVLVRVRPRRFARAEKNAGKTRSLPGSDPYRGGGISRVC
jgi:hypothetical protein